MTVQTLRTHPTPQSEDAVYSHLSLGWTCASTQLGLTWPQSSCWHQLFFPAAGESGLVPKDNVSHSRDWASLLSSSWSRIGTRPKQQVLDKKKIDGTSYLLRIVGRQWHAKQYWGSLTFAYTCNQNRGLKLVLLFAQGRYVTLLSTTHWLNRVNIFNQVIWYIYVNQIEYHTNKINNVYIIK